MVTVIGYEGRRRPGAPVSWGAGAMWRDDQLVNAASGLGRPRTDEEVNELVKHGALTLLPSPKRFRDTAVAPTPMVLETSRDAASQLGVGTLAHSAYVQESGESIFYVFRTIGAFDAAREAIANDVCHRLLYSKPRVSDDDAKRLLRLGRIVSAHHGGLNALVAFYSLVDALLVDPVEEDGEEARDIIDSARARVRTEPSLRQFDRLLTGLRRGRLDWVLALEGGIATGGGMDVDKMSTFFVAMREMHAANCQAAIFGHEYLESANPPRFNRAEAASALFTFKSNIDNATLGEQVARYLELEMLRDMLSGAEVPKTSKARDALQAIAHPDEETSVRQEFVDTRNAEGKDPKAFVTEVKALLQPVAPLAQTEADAERLLPIRPSEPFTLLGYQSGSNNEWDTIEVSIAPNTKPIRMSPQKSFAGHEPIGIQKLFGRRDAYVRPALYRVVCEPRIGGKHRYYLEQVSLIADEELVIDAIVSHAIGSGAFVLNLDIRIKRRGVKEIVVIFGEGDEMTIPTNVSDLSGARAWMQEYSRKCGELELFSTHPTKHLAPPVMPIPGEQIRCLWALEELGWSARVDDVLAKVRDGFGVSFAINITRVLKVWPDLIEPSSDGGLVTATDRGRRTLRAYRAVDRRAARRQALPRDEP